MQQLVQQILFTRNQLTETLQPRWPQRAWREGSERFSGLFDVMHVAGESVSWGPTATERMNSRNGGELKWRIGCVHDLSDLEREPKQVNSGVVALVLRWTPGTKAILQPT